MIDLATAAWPSHPTRKETEMPLAQTLLADGSAFRPSILLVLLLILAMLGIVAQAATV